MKLSQAKQLAADKARKTPDYYAWMIDYRNPVEGYTSAMGSGYHGPEIDKAIAKRDADAQYYIDLGYEILPTSYFVHACGACQGTGLLRLPKAKRAPKFALGKSFQCPFCNKGVPIPV